jgi:hypothetical protein
MKTIQKVSTIFFYLPQEQAILLTVGGIETRESTYCNFAEGDIGLCASVAFEL